MNPAGVRTFNFWSASPIFQAAGGCWLAGAAHKPSSHITCLDAVCLYLEPLAKLAQLGAGITGVAQYC